MNSEAGAGEAQWEHSTRANQMPRQEGRQGAEGTGNREKQRCHLEQKKQTRQKNKQIHKMHLLRGTDTI